MSDAEKLQLVGGPCDGEVREWPSGALYAVVTKDQFGIVQHWYRRILILLKGEGFPFLVYDRSDRNPLRMLPELMQLLRHVADGKPCEICQEAAKKLLKVGHEPN